MQGTGQHHANLRKRFYKNLEPYPHPVGWKRVLDRVIIAVALAGPVAVLPQVIQVYSAQDASSLSLATWGTWFCLNIVWLLYGLVHKELPIILANGAHLVFQGAIIAAIFAYG